MRQPSPRCRTAADLPPPPPLYHSARRDLCSTRGEIRDPAKASERTKACEAYVPLIDSLCSKKDNLQISNRSGELKFKWSSPLEGGDVMHKLKGLDRALEQERGMAWMLLAARVRDEAALTVDQCPRAPVGPERHECDPGGDRLVVVGGSVLETPVGDKSKPATDSGNAPRSPGPVLGECAPGVATTLRRAAGVYKHAATRVLPGLSPDPERPNELLPSMADAMRAVCLAEAQAATARRAEERGTGGDLVAKLHLGAHDLYKEADAVLNENIRDFNRISRKLQAYILLGASVHRARAYRCAAEEAFVSGDIGEAIACCDAANKHLARGRDAAGEADRWKTAALEESEALMNLRKKYVTENEVVYFEKVPERPAKKLPDGKVIVSEIEHVPVSIDVLSLE